MQIERMLGDLKVRRERLRQRVLRDTVPAADVFRALSAEAKAAPLREQVQ
jgi:hypothetical protein